MIHAAYISTKLWFNATCCGDIKKVAAKVAAMGLKLFPINEFSIWWNKWRRRSISLARTWATSSCCALLLLFSWGDESYWRRAARATFGVSSLRLEDAYDDTSSCGLRQGWFWFGLWFIVMILAVSACCSSSSCCCCCCCCVANDALFGRVIKQKVRLVFDCDERDGLKARETEMKLCLVETIESVVLVHFLRQPTWVLKTVTKREP